MAVVKTDNITTELTVQSTHPWFDYRNLRTGEICPMSVKRLDEIATELTTWVESDSNAYKLSQFYLTKGINRATWNEWCHKSPLLMEASNYAKEVIGNRRELGGLNNDLNPGIVSYTMGFYDQDWKEESVRRAALKEGSRSEASNSFTIVVDAIPNSSVVPERGVEDAKKRVSTDRSVRSDDRTSTKRLENNHEGEV